MGVGGDCGEAEKHEEDIAAFGYPYDGFDVEGMYCEEDCGECCGPERAGEVKEN